MRISATLMVAPGSSDRKSNSIGLPVADDTRHRPDAESSQHNRF